MPAFTRLVLPDLFRAQVIGHARVTMPDECCGLLAGRIADGVGVVTDRFGVRNDAASPTAYLTNPEDMLFALRAIRELGLELLAVYHSHPDSRPVPSRRDVEENTYGETVVHLIIGLTGREPELRAWWLADASCRPAEWSVEGSSSR